MGFFDCRRGRHRLWPQRDHGPATIRRDGIFSLSQGHPRLLPLAATLTTEEVFAAFLGDYKDFKTFFHGHTYTGNPLGCAVALANLELFAKDAIVEKMQPRVSMLRQRLRDEFLPLAHVSDIRQWGYMIGIELARTRRRRATRRKCASATAIRAARQRSVKIRPPAMHHHDAPLSIADGELTTLLDVDYDASSR